ncbi:glycerophosphodiester phosphodiesterase family protein [Streptomyces sp. NBC_00536]|uniref:glycerophosphodiester phosphodiesterase n=1 Tax=Streptomyces sp. NBC_00536 TaxID=2975769 RepID=UPI002E812E49|nr:glycerophosphodiester phosphodiesterase family protein [Streptomyces sp. NBC_00536]WUC77623.1 glycerophosphodiester phosphodiesterase family protein [Streptomyces sp. NBC_00536]
MTFLTIGHRGVMGVEPENTLRSFVRAQRSGMDAIALDLRLSKDGALVVLHDDEVGRTTDGSGAVADLTLAELRGLDAGQGERVPVFDEVLEAVAVPLVASVRDAGCARVLAEALRGRDLTARVEVSSPDDAVLAAVAGLVPGVRTVLSADRYGEDVVARALAVGAGSLSLDIRRLTLEIVESAHAAGLRVTGWTVNTQERLKLARALELDGAVTDLPEIRRTGRFTA